MRRLPWTLSLVPPIVVMGCADLVGIGELPGPKEAGGGDARTDASAPKDATTHDATHPDGSKSADGGEGGVDAAAVTLSLSPAGMHLLRGTSGSVTVDVARTGPAASVSVTVTGLPSGVTAAPLTIPASASTGSLTLTAAASSTLGAVDVSVQGSGSSRPLDLVVADPTGTVDTTFGTGGGLLTVGPSSGSANAVVVLPDGSILAGGNAGGTSNSGWALVHVLADGTVDTKYTPSLPTDGEITSIAVGPASGPLAGTVIVAGTSTICDVLIGSSQATVYVLQASGAPYDAFGGAGYWCTQDSAGTVAAGAAATSTGDVYAGVSTGSSHTPSLVHLTSTGAHSSAWSFAAPPSNLTLIGLMVDPSDDAIVTGSSVPAAGQTAFYALRFTPKGMGTPDPTFVGGLGNFGAPGGYLYTQCSALDPDAGVYLGGSGTLTGETPVLGHVNPAGVSDLGGDAGYTTNAFYIQDGLGYFGLAVQYDGKVVGVGTGSDMAGSLPFIARATTAGALDTTFNADAGLGYYFKQSGSQNLTYNAVATAPFPDGRIVIAGSEVGGMFLERIWP